MLDHKETEITGDEDISSTTILLKELECLCHLLYEPGDSREREVQDQYHQLALHLRDPSFSFFGIGISDHIIQVGMKNILTKNGTMIYEMDIDLLHHLQLTPHS